jgi:hypothetical protein
MGAFAQKMTTLIHQNITDAELKDWIMPNFTTTTHNDKSVAAIIMMGTPQEFFEYTFRGCGYPSVSLLSENQIRKESQPVSNASTNTASRQQNEASSWPVLS